MDEKIIQKGKQMQANQVCKMKLVVTNLEKRASHYGEKFGWAKEETRMCLSITSFQKEVLHG